MKRTADMIDAACDRRETAGGTRERDAAASRACERALLLAILLAFVAAFGCAESAGVAGTRTSAVRAAAYEAPALDAKAGVVAIESVGMTVANLERSVAFYATVLDFERLREGDATERDASDTAGARRARLRLGDEILELTQYDHPGRVVPADTRSNDRWFQHVAVIVSDMDRAYGRLRAHHVGATTIGPPQRLPDSNVAAAGIEAYYFKDPTAICSRSCTSHATRARRSGTARPAALFLGIDHTAIVVADTARSLAFYVDELGFRVAGESLNHGTEQEHLSAVPDARVRITGLRAPRGPGIELLEYLRPRIGRPMPADEQPYDLFHWETRLATMDDATIAPALRPAGFRSRVESGTIARRDPDGHVMTLRTKGH